MRTNTHRLLALCLALGLAATGCAGASRHPAAAGPEPPPITPPAQETVQAAVDRGVDFLLKTQNSNGSWGTSRNRFRDIWTPIPGGFTAFSVGTTSLCVMALCEAADDRPEVTEALRRAEDWYAANLDRLRLCSTAVMYNNWGHGLSIQALCHLLRTQPMDETRKARIRKMVDGQIARLHRYQFLDGGWGYYSWGALPARSSTDASTFMTATILIALHEARETGFGVPDDMIERAVAGLSQQRRPDFAYGYHFSAAKWTPTWDFGKPPAAMGRTQACNAAMRIWGEEATSDAVIKAWLKRLFARNGWLSMARKQNWPHAGYFGIAAYFYYYGHYYASVSIALLPEDERPYYQDYLAHVLLPHQEKDGSWWDFPLFNYHQQYGTAFAVMALNACLHADSP